MRYTVISLISFLLFSSCAQKEESIHKRSTPPSETSLSDSEQKKQRKKSKSTQSVTSEETKQVVEAVINGKIKVKGDASIAVLYNLERPAHRQTVIDWLKVASAKISFESEAFGYLDAKIDWDNLDSLLKKIDKITADQTVFTKLELNGFSKESKPNNANQAADDQGDSNSSFFGLMHSAGYGATTRQFRQKVADQLGKDIEDIAGQGSLVAIYDGGIDLSRTDVFQARIKDFFVAQDRAWLDAKITLDAFMKKEEISKAPEGLEEQAKNPTLKFMDLLEERFGVDLNGNLTKNDRIVVAIYKDQTDQTWRAKFRIHENLGFGDSLQDFALASAKNQPQTINLFTGNFYNRSQINPSSVAMGIKFKESQDGHSAKIAFFGAPSGSASHGIANLHMVGGRYQPEDESVTYEGVAPAANFLGMQTWNVDSSNYGMDWIPLARSIIQAAEAKADVIDLDIYTPGTRAGRDLLDTLVCRVINQTNAVPVVAAHNFGPLPDTVQSLAQSSCVLGIGASHSVARLEQIRDLGPVDPKLRGDEDTQTTIYSGRGLGLNGTLKPDIISPAYAYTAYGSKFTRFGGTSGATPTTAGAIALLKQAARLLGVELGFEQVKFLLQGASRDPKAVSIRDGYGHTDLARAWDLFMEYYDAGTKTFSIERFALSGHQRHHWNGRPNVTNLTIDLTRTAISGSDDGPIPMDFWIEMAGDSPKKSGWLKFRDVTDGNLQDRVNLDAPMFSETQSLHLYIDPAAYDQLQPGDHIAVVKGLRSDLKARGFRNVDFVMPVSFLKGEPNAEVLLETKPLYADQFQNFSLAAQVGDYITLRGQTFCDGQDAHPGSLENNGLGLSIDNASAYPHADRIMNGYDSMVLSDHPISFPAGKPVVSFAVRRRAAYQCDGPISAKVFVRRTGFRMGPLQIDSEIQNNHLNVEIASGLTLTTAGLSEADRFRKRLWRLKQSGDATLAIDKRFTGSYSYTLPFDTKRIVIRPETAETFQGILLTQTGGGAAIVRATSDSPYAAGSGSLSGEMAGEEQGLTIADQKAGTTITVIPTSLLQKSHMVIERDLPKDAQIKLPKKSIKEWLTGETKPVNVAVESPLLNAGASSDKGWRYNLQMTVAVEEFMEAGHRPDIEFKPALIWQERLLIPVH